MSSTRMYDEIRELIGDNKLKEAIEHLKSEANAMNLLDDVIMQSAKYNEIKSLIRNDIISFEQANISKAKIRHSLLQLVSELEQSKPRKLKKKSRRKVILVSTLLFFIAFVIIYSILANSSTKQENVKIGEIKGLQVGEEKTQLDTPNISSITLSPKGKETMAESTIKIKTKEPEKLPSILDESQKIEKNKYPFIEGQILDELNKGISDVTIQAQDGSKIKSNELGLFKITLKNTEDEYPFKIYLYYSKDSLQSKELVRVGQKNVILRFEK